MINRYIGVSVSKMTEKVVLFTDLELFEESKQKYIYEKYFYAVKYKFKDQFYSYEEIQHLWVTWPSGRQIHYLITNEPFGFVETEINKSLGVFIIPIQEYILKQGFTAQDVDKYCTDMYRKGKFDWNILMRTYYDKFD